MKSGWSLLISAVVCSMMGAGVLAQTPRPLSPQGDASAQVLGKWVKPERQGYAMGGQRYVDGKWIDIVYGRPLLRGREAFTGTGKDYGQSTVEQIPGDPYAPVWRAGANVSTRLKTEVPLIIGNVTVPAGEYSLFIDLKRPTEWTFIVSNWAAAPRIDPNNKNALYGSFGYTPDNDVVHAPMKVERLHYTVEELTWEFLDMTPTSGRIAIMWDHSLASVPFKVAQ